MAYGGNYSGGGKRQKRYKGREVGKGDGAGYGGGKGIGAGIIGDYHPGERKSTKPRPNYMEYEPVGVEKGLNARMNFDSEYHGPMYNYMRDPLTGNANERPEPYENDPANAKSKGLSFDIC